MVSVISFRVVRPNIPYQVSTERCAYQIQEINWTPRGSKGLTECLNQQVINNDLNLNVIHSCFQRGGPTLTYTDAPNLKFRTYNVIAGRRKLVYDKLKSVLSDELEMLARDHDAMNDVNRNVALYACVLFHNGEYIGHIYTWLSPVDPTVCFAFGSRARVDHLLLREVGYGFGNISGYLLEAARLFAVTKGAATLSIPCPIQALSEVLIRLKFEKKLIRRDIVGRSLAPYADCECYERFVDTKFAPILHSTLVG